MSNIAAFTFADTGALVDVEREFDSARIYIKADGDRNLTIKLNSKETDAIPVDSGMEIVAPFTKFFVSADAGAGPIQLILSSPADVRVSGLTGSLESVGNVGSVTSMEKVSLASNAQFTVSDAAFLVAPSNTSRKAVTIQNLDATDLYIGSNNSVAITNGIRLPENASYTIDRYTGDLYCIRASTESGKVAKFEEGI